MQQLLKIIDRLCCALNPHTTALQLLAKLFVLAVGVVNNTGSKVLLCDDLERAKHINLLPEIAVLLPRQKMRSHNTV
jgi:hypothetical protein